MAVRSKKADEDMKLHTEKRKAFLHPHLAQVVASGVACAFRDQGVSQVALGGWIWAWGHIWAHGFADGFGGYWWPCRVMTGHGQSQVASGGCS
jgi:hypothetical protein